MNRATPRGAPGAGKHTNGNLTARGYARRAAERSSFLAGDDPGAKAYRAARAHAWAEILRGRQSFGAAREARNAARQARRAQAVDGGAA
jgi:hypothetical protein